MAIRADLLYKENIITEDELNKIINPLNDDILEEYGADIALKGYSLVVKEFIDKINSFFEYGHFNKYIKTYKKVEEKQIIIRYRRKLTENGEYIDCYADDDGAEPYETEFIQTKYVQTDVKDNKSSWKYVLGKEDYKVYNSNENFEIENDKEKLPNEYLPLRKANISEIVNNIEKIRKLFFGLNVMTKKVALGFIEDILKGIKAAREENKGMYEREEYFNKKVQSAKLDSLKQNYIAYYNEYEDLMAKQSLWVKKSKHTHGEELDYGL